MKLRSLSAAFAFAAVFALISSAPPAFAAAAASIPPPVTCDRQCLYRVLDQYLVGLKAKDTRQVRWAARVRNTENNVELRVGDGLWGTITALGDYQMRIADPATGQVAVYGVVTESDTSSPFATRLRVENGAVAEAETLVARPQEAGVAFVTADIKPLPVWDEILPPERRVSREQMVVVANGYFDTLQLNDGTLHVQFDERCDRRENGAIATHRTDPTLDEIWNLGCADQFRLGAYRYDDRLRDRRFLMIDEERGIILAGGFIDHEGKLDQMPLTNGGTRQAHYRRPHSFVLLEAFKVDSGKIRQVEAVFHTVPYNMPSPWR
ncbi:MAG: hypothetical protein LBE59_11325 [Nevskiaceae bacterium]|jgi:hypothetical protein|nr:hypothetical protein [Nevskiaceae bacterium]